MKVTLHRTNNDLTLRHRTAITQERLHNRNTLLHSTGSHQHLRHKNLIILKLLTDHTHSIDQTLIQDIHRSNPLIQRLLHQTRNNLRLAILHSSSNFFKFRHKIFLLIEN